ncbi:MAG: ion transporter [Bifidobacteriaceae bacterium]|jgi:voltage-gated potassium channel|nr:ion transporter [Bifidobacteriaceae bacterium]
MVQALYNRLTTEELLAKEKTRYQKKLEDYGFGYGFFEKYKRFSRIPVIIICLITLISYALPIIFWDMPANYDFAFLIIFNITWIFLAIDYFIRLILAKKKGQFIVKNILDLIAIAIPQVRPLRLIRLLTLFTLFRKSVKVNQLNELILYTIYSFGLITVIGGLALTDCEHDAPNTTIHNAWDGLYLAIQSITLAGSGTHSPATYQGQIISSILMIIGVILLGVSARIGVAFFMRKTRRDNIEYTLSHAEAIKTMDQYRQLKKNINKALDDEDIES